MGFISWIVLGLIAGALAKFIMPGKDPGGILVTMGIGIVGAILGGWISAALGFGKVVGFSLGSLVVAVLGSVLLLFVYRLWKNQKSGGAGAP